MFPEIQRQSKERKFPEAVELLVRLNIDPTKGDQNIRGTCILPAGTGNEVKICVFTGTEAHEAVSEAGADMIGTEEMLRDIADGKIAFDKIIATPEQMPDLKRLARILGPKGLMPNPKSGTLVKPDELLEAVKLSKQGLIEYRVNEDATIMTKIGLRSFSDKDLESNADALLAAIAKKRPEVIKGRYFRNGQVKTTMGPPVQLDLNHY